MRKSMLTIENHLERDNRLNAWSVEGLGGQSHSTEYWVRTILGFELDETLPNDLREMFERAQACMVYGCYHYPLFTMGSEELYRFGEAAVRLAASEAKGPKVSPDLTFAKLINRLVQSGFIDEVDKERWNAWRWLRNAASHKMKNSLCGPNDALNSLSVTKELTENLFKRCRNDDY